MFLMKTKWIFFLTACLAMTLSSCLKSEDDVVIELTRNCQISSLTLSSDSVTGLSKVKFTIDQLGGRIFNVDSMPYGTKVEKVLCTLTIVSSAGVSDVEVQPYALPDSTFHLAKLADSVDFSAPVKFVVHAYDGITTKTYLAQVNIHQVNPDTMVWAQASEKMLPVAFSEQKTVLVDQEGEKSYYMYATLASGAGYQLYQAPANAPTQWTEQPLRGLPSDGLQWQQLAQYNKVWYVAASDGSLYQSADGKTWSLVAGAPAIQFLLGEVKAGMRQQGALAATTLREGKLTFCAMNAEQEWTMGEEAPEAFPAKGFATLQYESMYYQYLMTIGGRSQANTLLNTTWATTNGLAWTLMAAGESSGFTSREGAAVVHYDDKILMIGGLDAERKGLKDMYSSFDCGITWSLIDSLLVLPDAYVGRGYSSAIVDSENYLNLFGGTTDGKANDLNQLWRGRINRLITKE